MLEIYPVIIAGGTGTRFWPASRKSMPKQFLPFDSSGLSLIQATARRMRDLDNTKPLLIVTNKSQANLCKQQLPTADILSEPVAKNTAAAIALAAAETYRKNPEGVMLINWSDAAIGNEAVFKEVIERAANEAYKTGDLGLVGVVPEFACTGYGYIETSDRASETALNVKSFKEKPNQELAEEFIKAGNFFWNPGIFVWKASSIIESFQQHLPEIGKCIPDLIQSLRTDNQDKMIEDFFEMAESISIDCGILEKADNCFLEPAENLNWSDIGSWDVWGDFNNPDADGNTHHGDIINLNSKNNIVRCDTNQTIALNGVDDLIIICTKDAILITRKDQAQGVKDVVTELKHLNRDSLL